MAKKTIETAKEWKGFIRGDVLCCIDSRLKPIGFGDFPWFNGTSHVATYLGDGMVIEATRIDGVKIKHIDEVVKRYKLIKVKRWKTYLKAKNWLKQLVWFKSVEGTEYGEAHFLALGITKSLLLGGLFYLPLIPISWLLTMGRNPLDRKKTFICSELCYEGDCKAGRKWKGGRKRVKGWIRPQHFDRCRQRYTVYNIWRSVWRESS